jgi:ferrous iron transport protein B
MHWQASAKKIISERPTSGVKWPVFLFTYMGVLAWVASFAVYQGGRALGFD